MTASIEYAGDLRCVCTHLQSGTVIETDAPTDNHGKGERFSPTDTVCVALATCIITTMGIKAASMDIDLKGSKMEVKKHMLNDPRRIGCIDVHLQLRTNRPLDEKEKEILMKTGDHCPVMKSLHPDIEKQIVYTW